MEEFKKCTNCEEKLAIFSCGECDETFCGECDEVLHKSAKKRDHKRVELFLLAKPIPRAEPPSPASENFDKPSAMKPVENRPSVFSAKPAPVSAISPSKPTTSAPSPAPKPSPTKTVVWSTENKTIPPAYENAALDFAAGKEAKSAPKKPAAAPKAPTGKTCGECGKAVVDGEDSVFNSEPPEYFHVNCITCFICKRRTGPNHEVRGGIFYCARCAAGSPLPIQKKSSEPSKPSPVISRAGKCPACNEALHGNTCLADGKEWHHSCFICSQCKKELGSSYYEKDGALLCALCIEKASSIETGISDSTECRACFRRIEDQPHVVALGGVWHESCFVCRECKKRFPDGKFFHRDGKPYCQAHLKSYTK